MMVRTYVPPPYKPDQRTPMQKFMGDPPPGRSALEADKATWTAWEKAERRPSGLLDVKRRDGKIDRCVLGRDLNWRHEGQPTDIMFYRPVEIGRGGST